MDAVFLLETNELWNNLEWSWTWATWSNSLSRGSREIQLVYFAHGYVQLSFEYHQGRLFHTLSEQSLPLFAHNEKDSSGIQTEFFNKKCSPLFSFCPLKYLQTAVSYHLSLHFPDVEQTQPLFASCVNSSGYCYSHSSMSVSFLNWGVPNLI